MRPMSRARCFVLALGLFFVSASVTSGAAAPPPPPRPEQVFQRSFFFEEQVRERLERAVPAEQKALVEWGGSYFPQYTFFNDFEQDAAHVTVQDLRLWTQIQLDEVHRIYARMILRYTDWAGGDARGFRQHDLLGPNLEVGYYELDVSGAARKYGGASWPARAMVRMGRQYHRPGRGIALAEYLDTGAARVETKDLRIEGFGGRWIESKDNIDRSTPGFTRSRRNFYGLEAAVRSLPNHEPYVFVVWQRDWSEEKPEDPLQDYEYTSQYYGAGCRGELAPRTQYAFEGIFEAGKGSADGQVDETERIHAYAFNAEVEHFADLPLNPQTSLEYGFASGDSDRTRATTAAGGNLAGTDDEAFQGFGFVNSGLSLGARFTNLQFVRLGGRFTPYEDRTAAGRLDLGFNAFYIWKHRREGPISDTLAVDDSREIGHEVDVFAEWQMLSDLSVSLHYGRFWPGGSYLDDKPRDFFFGALTVSF